ncbi:MAG: hypothetical protein M0Z42_15525 [Actinomycetota bacterium]|nr:hypothetical protein [Actinomycetota bacterium]
MRNQLRSARLAVLGTAVATVSLIGAAAGVSGLAATAGAARAPHARAHKAGGSVSVWGEWSTTEQASFLAAVKPFEQ